MENQSLVVDLVSWVAKKPRPYSEVMDAWRTSCPRLSIWEDAIDHGFLKRKTDSEVGQMVVVTDKGRTFLNDAGWMKTD